jgi:hypothetical protein
MRRKFRHEAAREGQSIVDECVANGCAGRDAAAGVAGRSAGHPRHPTPAALSDPWRCEPTARLPRGRGRGVSGAAGSVLVGGAAYAQRVWSDREHGLCHTPRGWAMGRGRSAGQSQAREFTYWMLRRNRFRLALRGNCILPGWDWRAAT